MIKRVQVKIERKPAIMVFVAHSDDEVLGAGGTIAKYARDGYAVQTIICSFGESSHPHLRPEVIRKIRVQEAKRADNILGGAGVSFLGLKEGSFVADVMKNDGRLFQNLVTRVREMRPEKIITHDLYDNHPDHQAVYKIALDIISRLKKKPELYTFHVWTIANRRKGQTPVLYVDITKEFAKKREALHAFKSQIAAFSYVQGNNFLYLATYVKAFFAGLKKGVRYAEAFHKIALPQEQVFADKKLKDAKKNSRGSK